MSEHTNNNNNNSKQKLYHSRQPMITLTFIRHAESTLNLQTNLICGRASHIPLTSKGQQQASALGKHLKRRSAQFTKLYCSTAVRAKETAQFMCDALEYPCSSIEYFETLEEQSQGDWTNRERSEIYTPEIITKIQQDPINWKAPNGESQNDVEARIIKFIEAHFLPLYKDPSSSAPSSSPLPQINIGIVTHAMVIRCFLRRILNSNCDMNWKINLDNTSISQFAYNNDGWHLLRLNDASHLVDFVPDSPNN